MDEQIGGQGQVRRVPGSQPLPDRQISSLLEALSGFELVPTDSTLVLDAHQLAISEQLSWLDALIVEAAIRSRCDVLFSEDLSHGSQIAGITLSNPLQNNNPGLVC